MKVVGADDDDDDDDGDDGDGDGGGGCRSPLPAASLHLCALTSPRLSAAGFAETGERKRRCSAVCLHDITGLISTCTGLMITSMTAFVAVVPN